MGGKERKKGGGVCVLVVKGKRHHNPKHFHDANRKRE